MKKEKSIELRTVTIIRGLPGAGKTTYAQKMWPGSLLLEGDQYYMTDKNEYKFGEGLLGNSTDYVRLMLTTALSVKIKNVIVTLTSPDGYSANEFARIAKAHGYDVRRVWIDFNDGNTNQNRHNVPKEVIESMKAKWVMIPGEILLTRYLDGQVARVYEAPLWFTHAEHPRPKSVDHDAKVKAAHDQREFMSRVRR